MGVEENVESLVMTDKRNVVLCPLETKKSSEWNEPWGKLLENDIQRCSAPAGFMLDSIERLFRVWALEIIKQRNKSLRVSHYGNDLWFMMQFSLFFLRSSEEGFEKISDVIWGPGEAWVFMAPREQSSFNLCMWSCSRFWREDRLILGKLKFVPSATLSVQLISLCV